MRTETYTPREVAAYTLQKLAWRYDKTTDMSCQEPERGFRIGRHWTLNDFAARMRQTFPEAFHWLDEHFHPSSHGLPFHILRRSQKSLSIAFIREACAGEDIYRLLHEKRSSSWKSLKLYLGTMILLYATINPRTNFAT